MRFGAFVIVSIFGVIMACSGSNNLNEDTAMPDDDDWTAVEASHGADVADGIRHALSADPVYRNAGRFAVFTSQPTDLGLLIDGQLEVPIEDREFPTEWICTVPRTGPVIGARWLLDYTTLSVLAVSPIWEDASCL